MTLDDFYTLLITADDQIQRESAAALTDTTEQLRAYAQSIAHRRTGNMADTMHRMGPFPVGNGALETRIESGAWYAEEEIARGGTHDWVARTYADNQGAIQALADTVADRGAIVLTGGA